MENQGTDLIFEILKIWVFFEQGTKKPIFLTFQICESPKKQRQNGDDGAGLDGPLQKSGFYKIYGFSSKFKFSAKFSP